MLVSWCEAVQWIVRTKEERVCQREKAEVKSHPFQAQENARGGRNGQKMRQICGAHQTTMVAVPWAGGPGNGQIADQI